MKKHILLVDDEPNIRSVLEQYFTSKGYRVTAVETAIEAERIAKSDPPALLISDLQLEDSDGLTMIAKLKDTLPTTPVMLLTGVSIDATTVAKTLGDQIACYFQKTTPLQRILAEVQRLIG